MVFRIYFNEKPLFIASQITPVLDEYLHHEETVFIDEFNSHTVKAMIHEMQSEKILTGVFLNENPLAVLQAFKKKFNFIIAAGGFVHTPDHEVLMIFRRGKWDLPKGKLDQGEDLESCALREITEETGVTNLNLIEKLTVTYHTYKQDGKHWLKESHWYRIQTNKTTHFLPQTEEDIQKCEWVPIDRIAVYAENTHRSILDVLESGMKRIHENRSI